MTTVQIIAKGAVGCGKTAVLHEIYIALKAIGVPVEYAKPDQAESERRLGTPDDMDRLLKDGLTVVLNEFHERSVDAPTAPGGVDPENAAWDWLESLYLNVEAGHDPNDRDYSANEMVDAFMAGMGRRKSTS